MIKNLQHIWQLVLGLCLSVFVLGVSQISMAQQIDGIAAVVNKNIITNSQLQERVHLLQQQFSAASAKVLSASKLREQALQQLIDENLINEKATQIGMKIDNASLDAAIKHIALQNQVSVQALQQKVKAQGLSYQDYRSMIRKQMLMAKVMQAFIGPKINIDQSEVNALLKQHAAQSNKVYQLYDVIIDAKYPQLVTTIKANLQQGKQVAKHAGVTTNELDWRSLDDLPGLFVPYVKSAKQGDVLGPITAPNGLHVIKVTGVKQDNAGPGLSQQQAQQIVYQQHFAKEQQKLMKKLRKTAYIKIMASHAS